MHFLQVVCLDLRKFALKADKQKAASGKGKPNQTLEKASEGIMACFRLIVLRSRIIF
jgi:nuclear mRNA export protein PCID2/THP1